MGFKLQKNNQAIWNETVIKFYEDNGNAYGFTKEMADDLRKRIASGETVKRIASNDADYYSIVSDNEQQIGELIVIKDCEYDEEELDIAIFVKHQRLAERVIAEYISSYAKSPRIVATIKESNPMFGYVKSMLTNLGFMPIAHIDNAQIAAKGCPNDYLFVCCRS